MKIWRGRLHDITPTPQEGAELVQQAVIASSGKRRAIIAIAALATLIYLGGAYAVDSAGIIAAVDQLAWPGCTLVPVPSGANDAIRFDRWRTFLTRLGHRLPVGRHLLYYLSGFAFAVSRATAGNRESTALLGCAAAAPVAYSEHRKPAWYRWGPKESAII
jgi:hypothetical protein